MKILIVDDHAIVREGARRLLASLPGAQVSEAATAVEALNAFRADRPDVVVLDINLDSASGLELLQRFKIEDRRVPIVMFTMHAEPMYAVRALRAGALGYVSKSAPASELVTAVRRAVEGDRYVDLELATELAATPETGNDPFSQLTNREIEILRLLGEGKSLADIAGTFGIAYKTVANACTRLKEKLGLERTADLIRVSVERRNS